MERFVATTKATQKQLSILTFVVKASPAVVCLSLPPQSKRPLKFQVSYTWRGIHSLLLTIFLSANCWYVWNATTCSCNHKYKYVFYSVWL